MKIDCYSFGYVKIDGLDYRSDVIIYPDRVDDKWWRKEGHRLQMEDLDEVFGQKPEILIVGLGQPGLMKVDGKVEEYCRKNEIHLMTAPTEKAVEEYNHSAAITQKVIACLHLTC
ncbi:MAG: Mth938-like domain-containing protein [Candidatus Edwardsbacteria bacterium]|nr:Mth938-like domain-containing protein [Candidatus Edwardsbacteria bacterium]